MRGGGRRGIRTATRPETAHQVLQLPNVTLCCVDAKNHAMALRALDRSRREIQFGKTLLFTNALPLDIHVPEGIDVITTGPIESHEEYSRFVLKKLYPRIETSHVLLVQWDGYVAHPELWMGEFLDCDYLGAPWPDGKAGHTVGNGGFSLRSRKLLEALQDDRFPLVTNTEDVTICGYHRPRLESDFGIRFGTPELAKWFSFEMDAGDVIAGAKTFGFHGFFNMFLVESEQEIVAMAPLISESIARSEMTGLLLKNLMKFRQFAGGLALARRMLEFDPENGIAADAMLQAQCGLDERHATTMKEHRGGVTARILQKIGLR
jgi:uncharacterized protein DUF5672